MKILVVGSGGREHALVWKLSQEAQVIAAPGNPGIAEIAACFPVAIKDFTGLLGLVQEQGVDLVVVGPEDPLVDGLADFLRENSVRVYGPNKAGARLEGSKAFSKQMMDRAGVPTAQGKSFDSYDEAIAFAEARDRAGHAVVIKASGNALGKGVVVCSDLDEAKTAIQSMMIDQVFGDAGSTIVVEDRLQGREFSLLTIVGDKNFYSLPVAQDYKRIYSGDKGPNTGGMGTYSPVDWVSDDDVILAEQLIVAPMVDLLRSEGIIYRGTLFSGIMMDSGNPYCIEYNVRFGDPETQTVMARLGTGFADALNQAAKGELIVRPEVLEQAAVTVVLASSGYPGPIEKGFEISIGELPPESFVFHAGTAMQGGQLVTNGGRVFGLTSVGSSVAAARARAYETVKSVSFTGAQYRDDIAKL